VVSELEKSLQRSLKVCSKLEGELAGLTTKFNSLSHVSFPQIMDRIEKNAKTLQTIETKCESFATIKDLNA